MCVQCAMRAVLEGKEPPHFEGTIEEHMAQYHPDPAATAAERKVMEQILKEKMKESKSET